MTASSWYRRTIWNYKGNREYTRTGYEAASSRFVEEDLDVDCSERHYMITGSNSGIGLQTALEVARRGGVIHMVCRNREAAAQARSEIITTTGNDKIHLHIVDLAKPREVIRWALKFAAQHESLHVLIHNAGCMVHERLKDEDGIETNFAVNTLAVHILTLTFMPLLQRSQDARVVIVSSAGLLGVRLDPHDLMHDTMDPFEGRLVYSQNKRQQVVMCLWYAQRYNNIHFSSMHPGWADTPAVRNSIPQFYEMMKDNLRTASQGADTVVWLAISKAALKHPSGLFFQDRVPVNTHLPLAWTKSSIEEEDMLMTAVQHVYTKIYEKMFPQGPNTEDTTEAATDTTQQQQQPQQPTKTEETKPTQPNIEETSLTEQPKEPEPTPIPVLPPPPPPASKITALRSEVREVAEIHAPPPSAQGKENGAPDVKENVEREVKETKEEEKVNEVVTEMKKEEEGKVMKEEEEGKEAKEEEEVKEVREEVKEIREEEKVNEIAVEMKKVEEGEEMKEEEEVKEVREEEKVKSEEVKEMKEEEVKETREEEKINNTQETKEESKTEEESKIETREEEKETEKSLEETKTEEKTNASEIKTSESNEETKTKTEEKTNTEAEQTQEEEEKKTSAGDEEKKMETSE